MTLAEFKEQTRTRRSKTDTMVAANVKLVVLDDDPEIVGVLWWYDRQKPSKPWGFLMKKKDLPVVNISP